ncbi:MAG: hypothetical protein BWY59_00069 [Verrucomicrobia bacterium ADurb.Bin345]|nr:MAG: hypothetical protein BWY59_00069 [Verrucomicrobia bacterium ADurb.Bin345]
MLRTVTRPRSAGCSRFIASRPSRRTITGCGITHRPNSISAGSCPEHDGKSTFRSRCRTPELHGLRSTPETRSRWKAETTRSFSWTETARPNSSRNMGRVTLRWIPSGPARWSRQKSSARREPACREWFRCKLNRCIARLISGSISTRISTTSRDGPATCSLRPLEAACRFSTEQPASSCRSPRPTGATF